MNTFPWNEWMRLAREGDTKAALQFCRKAEPVIDQVCRARYFTDHLGRDDTRSIAVLALLEFLMEGPANRQDREIPRLLKRVVKFELINQVHRQETRRRRELHGRLRDEGDTAPEEGRRTAEAAPRSGEEPEDRLLRRERTEDLNAALSHLTLREQAVIRACYYQEKSAGELAREFSCTPQAVRKVRRSALRRLRGLLDEPVS